MKFSSTITLHINNVGEKRINKGENIAGIGYYDNCNKPIINVYTNRQKFTFLSLFPEHFV